MSLFEVVTFVPFVTLVAFVSLVPRTGLWHLRQLDQPTMRRRGQSLLASPRLYFARFFGSPFACFSRMRSFVYSLFWPMQYGARAPFWCTISASLHLSRVLIAALGWRTLSSRFLANSGTLGRPLLAIGDVKEFQLEKGKQSRESRLCFFIRVRMGNGRKLISLS